MPRLVHDFLGRVAAAAIASPLALVLCFSTVARAEAHAGSQDAAVPTGSLGAAQQDVVAREYQVTWQDHTVLPDLPAAWHAPNRAQGFRTYFTERGIRIVPRTEDAPSWEWGLSWIGYGRAGVSWKVTSPTLSPSGDRIDYRRLALEETYENTPRGLEQRFTLPAPPEESHLGEETLRGTLRVGAAPDLVHVDLALVGNLSPVISEDGQAIDFVTAEGVREVRYTALHVTDARGDELRAWMEGFAEHGVRGIRLVLDTEDAVYPLTIDPLTTAPAWTAEANQTNAQFGLSATTAGDVNGDGYSDVIVGAYLYDNGQTDEGRAFVYLGSPSGLSATAAWTVESNQANAQLGVAVATAGDVNGDGYSDVIVGAHFLDNGQTDEGAAYVYLGSAGGLATTPAWVTESNQANARYGYSVATAGDVNGDGYSDVIVGAIGYDNGQTDEGRAYVYLGSASGLATTAAWTGESNQASAFYAISVATAGDVNGDGYADVIVGAYFDDNGETDEGRAYLYLGSASGLATAASWIGEVDQPFARFGSSVATAGDVNGDGYADVLVGASLFDHGQTDEGYVFLYSGSAAGLSSLPLWTAEINQQGAQLGASVSAAGDVNGDGYSDVILGAHGYDNGQPDEGRAFVYLGSANGPSPSAVWTSESDQASAFYGISVATAGDVNGDGYSDVLVGAYLYDNGQTDEGGAFLYLGSASGPATALGWGASGNQEGEGFGGGVTAAGDVNGDGYDDVIVGAPFYDNGESNEGAAFVYLGSPTGPAAAPAWTAQGNQVNALFGIAVASAGDVNGDGYADVIVGASGYDNDLVDEGKAFVYLGSPSGLATTAAWTADDGDSSARFGISVSTAGDVNGDGYSDVIVGADFADFLNFFEGRAFVYLGSSSGLTRTAVWTAEGGQEEAQLGCSVASAGDVNGDGYSDVIVGALGYGSYNGRSRLYLGSATGLATSATWTVDGDQSDASFGYSVASAGDVNGDGYADVVVGAPFYDNGQSDEGRVYLYLGSATGPSQTAAQTFEGEQVSAQFGTSVSGAGDVNGDGYSDVVVGASLYDNGESDEGRAYVYLGSAAGLSSTAWTAEPNQAGNWFGYQVASAGDVNGDGYADVIVGEPLFKNGATEEGAVQLYYGNGGRGLSLRPQQRRSDDAAPVGPLGTTGDPLSFRTAALGRSSFGRARLKLEREVKPLGSFFNGVGTQTAAAWVDSGTTGASLNELSSSLSPSTPYHWRVRLRYDPSTSPFASRSRWVTVSTGGWQETRLRTNAVAAPAGSVPDGASGPPLLAGRPAQFSPFMQLTWAPSCMGTDFDFEVYQGTLGSFTSHVPIACSTGGATSWTFRMPSASSYFLVVPHNASREGSYGKRTGNVEIPPGAGACMPQQIATCP